MSQQSDTPKSTSSDPSNTPIDELLSPLLDDDEVYGEVAELQRQLASKEQGDGAAQQ